MISKGFLIAKILKSKMAKFQTQEWDLTGLVKNPKSAEF